MSDGARLGILGGTLDPMHLGHVETALAARAALGLDRVLVLPSRVPPHRPNHPHASGYHRFAMAALAIDGVEGLAVSDMELRAPGPSYTADTLTRLHARGLSALQIFFITGADAFAEIETWSRYPQVLELAHFVVVSRPGHPAAGMKLRVPALAGRMHSAALVEEHLVEPAIFLLDARTPDVSSTEIRRRVSRGEPLTGLVPKAVERHIAKHELYSPVADTTRADHLHGEDD
jgi:nicotinate-nucleotide adenylyltransferase